MNLQFSENKIGVLVLGGHIQALGIIRIYGRLGIPTAVIDKTKRCIARHSRYCGVFICVNDDDVLSFLESEKDRGNYKGWLVFPTNDLHVKILSQSKTTLEPYYKVTADIWERVQVFYNKKLSYQLAGELEIPYPKTYFPESIESLNALNISYPCIIKPAIMYDFFSKTKKKVFLCNSKMELIANYKKALSIIPADEIIIQDVIPGANHNQYSACFLFLNGQSYVSLTACRMRQHPIAFGNATTYAEITDTPQIIGYAELLLKEVGYNGLCEVEFKFDDRDGKFKLLEVNPRTWKWHSIANKSQTPFLKSYYHFLCGQEVCPTQSFKYASFYHFTTDFPMSLIMMFKGLKNWNRIRKPLENAVWASDDIKPWFFEKFYFFSLLKNR
jgi:predicted ATP-grasp superfamily ATP-dependent carboligase